MPSGILLSAAAWTYDELGDLGDGCERLAKRRAQKNNKMHKNTENDWKDLLELFLLPFLLGMFEALIGVNNPLRIIIPGSSEFTDYIISCDLPEPWASIVGAIVKVIFFSIGMIIACGCNGFGWIFYLIGSTIGQYAFMKLLSVVIPL